MPKKVKYEQIHGKLDDNFTPTTLDQIWGNTGLSRYGTMSEIEYAAMLDAMNKSDLQTHATKVGVMPIDNRQRLRDALIKTFKRYVASYQKPKIKPSNNKLPSQKVLDILAEGR